MCLLIDCRLCFSFVNFVSAAILKINYLAWNFWLDVLLDKNGYNESVCNWVFFVWMLRKFFLIFAKVLVHSKLFFNFSKKEYQRKTSYSSVCLYTSRAYFFTSLSTAFKKVCVRIFDQYCFCVFFSKTTLPNQKLPSKFSHPHPLA